MDTNYRLTQETVGQLFHHPHPRQRKRPAWQVWLQYGLVFGILFILSSSALPAYAKRFGYWWKLNVQKQSAPASPPVLSPPSTPALATTPVYDFSQQGKLTIEKIGLRDVPITWNVAADEIIPSLQSGVSHYRGTGLPGSREHQNVFITGHSSNWWWEQGNYNTVFALLDKLAGGDMIQLTVGGGEFEYKVREVFSIRPDQTEVLGASPTPILSLMTCWPVGTTARRWIVVADQISPATSAQPTPAYHPKPPPLENVLDILRTFVQ